MRHRRCAFLTLAPVSLPPSQKHPFCSNKLNADPPPTTRPHSSSHQYHNRARDFFKITQIAWDSLQAQPANMNASAAAAATAAAATAAATAAAAKTAAAAAASKVKSAKRRPSSTKNAAAAAAATAAAATAAAAAAAAAASAEAVPPPPKGHSQPYQTKAGIHAKAVHEQQLLSRPKTVRAPGGGVRKDLLTGRTQVGFFFFL